MIFGKERMSSYVTRGNKLIKDGKTPEAAQLIGKGMQHYTDRILKSIYPYAKADAGLVVTALRLIADEIEKEHPESKELAAFIKGRFKLNLNTKTKIQKPNKE